MEIAVIGGGHGSHAAVVEMIEKGHRVRWWRRTQGHGDGTRGPETLTVSDHRGTRAVTVPAVSADLGAAVRDAELIIIPLPATSHPDLARRLAPLLRDGQIVLLTPGTLGTIVFAKAVHESGTGQKSVFAETGTLPYLVRRQPDGPVVISAYATRLPTGVFPTSAASRAIDKLREAYPSIEYAGDAFSGALMNAGPIIHPPLIIMNAGPLEGTSAWDIHNEGTQPSVRRVTDMLDAERIAIRAALGYGSPHFPLADHYREDGDEWMYGRRAHRKLVDSGNWREKIDLREHRYMVEDTLLGLSLMTSLARRAGVATPVADGLLAIGRAIAGKGAHVPERTLESLGLGDLSRDELQRLLRDGYGA